MSDFCDRYLIQPACALLTVAADERNGCSIVKKSDSVFYLPLLDLQLCCYCFDVYLVHSFYIMRCLDSLRSLDMTE